MLHGWKAAVYLACDRAQPMPTLMDLAEVRRAGVDEQEVRAFLERCVQYQLMIHNGRSWLGVAVHVPAREEREEVLAPAELVTIGQPSAR